MTRRQWILIVLLGLGVLLLYCIGGIVVLNRLTQPVTVTSLPLDIPTDLAVPTVPSSPTLRLTTTPTTTATPRATATWVIPPPQAPIASTPVITSSNPYNSSSTVSSSAQTAGVSKGPVLDALSKSKEISAFRIEYDLTVKGNFPDIPAEWNAAQGFSLFSVTGAVNGKDSQIAFKGILSVLFTGDPAKSIEIMSLGDKTYIKGPAPLISAAENKWYVSTGKSSSAVPKVNEFVDLINDPNADLSAFRRTSIEIFDNRRCEVYTGDKVATFKLFQSLNPKDTPNKDSLNEVDSAETKFWVCDDGYFHQMTMSIDGRNKDKPNEKIAFQLKLHIFDLNGNVKIAPPQNAAPLQMPAFIATPTKTK